MQLTKDIINLLAVNVDKSHNGEPRVIKAKQDELANIKNYNTYEEVTDSEIPMEHVGSVHLHLKLNVLVLVLLMNRNYL